MDRDWKVVSDQVRAALRLAATPGQAMQAIGERLPLAEICGSRFVLTATHRSAEMIVRAPGAGTVRVSVNVPAHEFKLD